MKLALALMLSFAASLFAADPKPVKNPETAPQSGPKEGQQIKRLATVTWDLDAHKLVWVVQTGKQLNGEFVPSSQEKYEITPDQAVMAVADQQRGFDGDEAQALNHLLDILSVYCAESVVWWDQGQGTPLPPKTKTGPNPEMNGQKPVRVDQPKADPKTKYKVPAGDYVAAAGQQ